jgi:DNA repair exonuclease SbcCD ATPase subunit
MMKKEKESSIIELIESMVKAGESEEKIISSLKDLGVKEEQAKKLLLLGEADTFALLKSEIRKIVKDSIEQEKENLDKQIRNEVKQQTVHTKDMTINEVTKDIEVKEKELESDLKKYKIAIETNRKEFQNNMYGTISDLTSTVDKTRHRSNELSERVTNMERDMGEIKATGVGLKNYSIRRITFIIGIVFLIIAGYIFLSSFGSLTTTSFLIALAFALIGVTSMFVAQYI